MRSAKQQNLLDLVRLEIKPIEKKQDQQVPIGQECDFWNQIIEIMFSLGANSTGAVMKTVSASIDGSSLIIHCEKGDLAYNMLSNPESVAMIKSAAERASGELYSIKFSKKTADVSLNEDDGLAEILNNANDILYKE